MAVGAVVARIITQYSDKGSKAAARDINKLGKSFDKFAGKVGKAFVIAGAAAAAFAVKIGTDAVKGAMADQKQQVALATALRNTTGATDEAIAATVKYLDAKELLVGVDNAELIPSLQTLVQATKDVTQAQILQNLALDISAGTGKNLEAVSLALAKAIGGNVGALTRLGVPLDAAAVKSKDLNGILVSLGETFAGQAGKRAETFEFRMMRLQLAFNQVLDQLGYAFIPVLENFAQILMTKVIPAVQTFINENGDKLVSALSQALKAVLGFGFTLFKVFSFVAKNKNVFITLGAIFAATFVAAKVIAFVTAIGKLVAAYKAIRAAAIGAAAAQAAATGGLSVAAAAAGVAAFAATLGGLYLAVNTANNAMDKLDNTGEDLEFSFDGLNDETDSFLASLKGLNINLGKVTTKTKAQTAADVLAVKAKATLAALAKLGVKPTTEKDPIQLEAARLNLLKQNNLEEQRRLAAIVENMKAQMMANEAVQRYVDLLGVVADQNISPEEVILLSLKWGISQEAVVAYTTAVFAVNDAKLSTEEIDLLAKQWGVTKQQAEMYLDFFKAINDGKLDQSEVNALMEKWKLTSKEVTDYAKKISDGVTPSDLWPTPGNQAAQSWRNALAALNAYLAAVGVKLSPTAPTAPTAPRAPTVPGVTPSAKAITDAAKGIGVTPSALAAQESGAIGAASIAAQMAAAQAAAKATAQQKMLDSIALSDPMAQASLQSGLAGGASLSAALSGSRYAAQAAAQYGSGTTVNVTVQGSVTTEADLVSSIRNGLLQGQNNGQAIVKSATAI